VSEIKEIAAFRPVRPEDIPYIYSTILPSAWLGNPFFKKIKREIFFPNYRVIIDSIVQGKEVEILVACFMEDPNLILGYSISCNDVLHYVYVKGAYRRKGLGKMLIPNKQLNKVSHYTTMGEFLDLNLELDPFVIAKDF
jgi:GNAT superfamily N-acetyltransferase